MKAETSTGLAMMGLLAASCWQQVVGNNSVRWSRIWAAGLIQMLAEASLPSRLLPGGGLALSFFSQRPLLAAARAAR